MRRGGGTGRTRQDRCAPDAQPPCLQEQADSSQRNVDVTVDCEGKDSWFTQVKRRRSLWDQTSQHPRDGSLKEVIQQLKRRSICRPSPGRRKSRRLRRHRGGGRTMGARNRLNLAELPNFKDKENNSSGSQKY